MRVTAWGPAESQEEGRDAPSEEGCLLLESRLKSQCEKYWDDQKVRLGFSITSYRKTQMNFFATQ